MHFNYLDTGYPFVDSFLLSKIEKSATELLDKAFCNQIPPLFQQVSLGGPRCSLELVSLLGRSVGKVLTLHGFKKGDTL